MNKLMLVFAALAMSAPAHAATHYLVRQWTQGGNMFCQYTNGTVLNVGARTCPMTIQG